MYSIPTLGMGMVSSPVVALNLALRWKNIRELASEVSERLLSFALSNKNELVSATQGTAPLEEAAFVICLVQEVVLVQRKIQRRLGQNYYDDGERQSALWKGEVRGS